MNFNETAAPITTDKCTVTSKTELMMVFVRPLAVASFFSKKKIIPGHSLYPMKLSTFQGVEHPSTGVGDQCFLNDTRTPHRDYSWPVNAILAVLI